MTYVDFHCDTISKLMKPNIYNDKKQNLYCNNLSVDIKKLQNSNCLAQFFALFVNLNKTSDPLKTCLSLLDLFYNELSKNSSYISLATSYKDILYNKNKNKISALLTIEEGECLEGTLYNLRNFYRLGVRLITLTWNFPNTIGFPNYKKEYMTKGLTPFGFNLINEMNKLGMIIDVSHLSDKGFYDVAKTSSKPFIASHSNSRYITNHPRNLTDNMIKVLSNKGGVMGLNFEKSFLGSSKKGKISEMIHHLKHIKNIGGVEVLSIGSDFDGIDTPSEVKNASYMYKLKEGLSREGFTQDEIEKIFYKNALRVIKETLQ